jgi:hypothetical protein
MDRRDKQKYYDRYGEVDRNLDQNLHRHADRGRTSFDLDNDEYDQRGGRNNDRDRDSYSNHTRSNAGDRYRDDADDRFDDQNQYSSSRNYGGMGGYGGAQGFGSSRGGYAHQDPDRNQDRGRYDATSGRGSRPDEDQRDSRRRGERQGEDQIYGGYRSHDNDASRSQQNNSGRRGGQQERANRNQEEDHAYSRHQRGRNNEDHYRSTVHGDTHRSEYSRSGFANTGDNPDRNRDTERISGGDFSPMLGGGPSRGWYSPTEGGYSRQGGYVGQRGVDRGSRRANRDEDNDSNYGQTFGDDIHYDPTSRDRRDTHVQDTERRSMEKYGSESRDLDQLKGWHYDRSLDRNYGRENQSGNQHSFRNQDRQGRGRNRDDNQ